jgi:hypothetical protein
MVINDVHNVSGLRCPYSGLGDAKSRQQNIFHDEINTTIKKTIISILVFRLLSFGNTFVE